jgi:signal transduction histidine kinase
VTSTSKHVVARGVWVRRLLSLPVAAKITGVGALVGLLFATIVGYQVQERIATSLYRDLAANASTSARLMAESLAKPLAVGDLVTVRQVIRRGASAIRDVSYILVEDSTGKILAHSFDDDVPRGLTEHRLREGVDAVLQQVEVGGHNVMDASAPILAGKAGHLHVGLSDFSVTIALESVQEAIVWTLVTCMILGQLLALALAFILTRPIHHLVDVSNRLGEGDFGARATVYADDEIGRLAASVNRMAVGLEGYHEQVADKELQRRVLLGRLTRAQEDERRRLALELHDELGQSLSSLLMQVRSCEGRCFVEGGTGKRLEAEILELIANVRQLAFALRPAILDDYGLDAALRRYVQEMGKQGKLKVDYHGNLKPDERLPEEVESALYRVVQEAMTNVLRHSEASSVSIVLLKGGSSMTLLVEDDGVGMNAAAALLAHKGVGLVGMRERASLLGGQLVLESEPGRGTLLKVVVPLGEER